MLLDFLYSPPQLVIKQAKKVIDLTNKRCDDATVDLVVGRLEEHDKQAWMLKSSI